MQTLRGVYSEFGTVWTVAEDTESFVAGAVLRDVENLVEQIFEDVNSTWLL